MSTGYPKSALIYNDWLTLSGIPAAAHEYRLGNRSALDWVIDQHRVERSKTDPDEILSDPNRRDDEEYIVRLVGHVITVGVETMKIVQALPALEADEPKTGISAGDYATQAELDAAHVYLAEDNPAPEENDDQIEAGSATR
ncbi:MAG: type ISP restriction/modification enzyme [Opitutaceae bacterium]